MDKNTKIVIAAFLLLGLGFVMPRKSWAIPSSALPYAADIAAAERFYQLPPKLLARVLYQESRFRDDIIKGDTTSSAGAVGIAQIIPKWHPNVDPLNAQQSIYYAASYLAENYNRFGSWHRALAAYNWGPGNVASAIADYGDKWLRYAPEETQNYVYDILNDLELSA